MLHRFCQDWQLNGDHDYQTHITGECYGFRVSHVQCNNKLKLKVHSKLSPNEMK